MFQHHPEISQIRTQISTSTWQLSPAMLYKKIPEHPLLFSKPINAKQAD